MSLPALYKLTEDFSQLMELDTEDDVTAALIELCAGDIEAKTEDICKLVKQLSATAAVFRDEEKRIAERRKAIENKEAAIREYMKQALLAANIDKVTAGTFTVRVALSQGSVTIDDLSAIPAKFLTVIPEQYVPDKAAIKSAIKAGETVTGAHIEAGATLTIR